MSKENSLRTSYLPGTVITVFVVILLIFLGPAQAVSLIISGLQPLYAESTPVKFQISIEISTPDQFVPVTNISLDVAGPVNLNRIFSVDGTPVSGNPRISITPVKHPKSEDYGYGYGIGCEGGTCYGFGYGYGYGTDTTLSFIYNVTMDMNGLPHGDYTVTGHLNTGKAGRPAFSSAPVEFTIAPFVNAIIDVTPRTLNLRSNIKWIMVGIELPEGYDAADIDVSSIKLNGIVPADSVKIRERHNRLKVRFDGKSVLDILSPGDQVITITGQLTSGILFVGTDTVKVIGSAGSISGYKIHDGNGNGKWDAGEAGIPNWNITLYGVIGVLKTTTNDTGFYRFDYLPAGGYFVQEEMQSGWRSTASTFRYIQLGNGQKAMNNNFTNRLIPPGSIGGYKINDMNGDGRWNAGEPGIADWNIKLCCINGKVKETVTNDSGYYRYENLPPSGYIVTEEMKTGWWPTRPASRYIQLAEGQNSLDNHFTNRQLWARMNAMIDVKPSTLNLQSNGKWVKVDIALPEAYPAADIDVSSITLNGIVSADSGKIQENHNGLKVKFDRRSLRVFDILGSRDQVISITGQLTSGTAFEGSDTVKVKNKDKK